MIQFMFEIGKKGDTKEAQTDEKTILSNKDKQDYPSTKYIFCSNKCRSTKWITKKWFINENKLLVIQFEDQHEEDFIIWEMLRLSRKTFGEQKGDFWAFNDKKILLNEELFLWTDPGCIEKLKAQKKTMKKKKGQTEKDVVRSTN